MGFSGNILAARFYLDNYEIAYSQCRIFNNFLGGEGLNIFQVTYIVKISEIP